MKWQRTSTVSVDSLDENPLVTPTSLEPGACGSHSHNINVIASMFWLSVRNFSLAVGKELREPTAMSALGSVCYEAGCVNQVFSA